MTKLRRLGLLLDLPLCRFSWCILPHSQITINIWQPQYTLMFSSLLAEKDKEHYYMHVLLPGGAESLGQDGYELVPGSKASLTGTLMRVAYAQRVCWPFVALMSARSLDSVNVFVIFCAPRWMASGLLSAPRSLLLRPCSVARTS